MEAAGDLLLMLYCAARELPIEQFQEFALLLVKPVLQFGSAIWGAGTLLEAGVTVHLAHLHEIPMEHLVEWETLNPQDRVIPAVLAAPGMPKIFHAPTLFAGRKNSPMLDFANRAGWLNAMVTAFVVPGSKCAQWISLYRLDREQHYSDHEQRLARFLMPHLVEALVINRALNLKAVYGDKDAQRESLAMCDRKGLLHYVEPEFIVALDAEWPGFEGGTLPEQLINRCIPNRESFYVGNAVRIQVRDGGEVVFLRARKKSRVDELSARERDVAHQFALGKSYKEIARLVGIAPATVRHHLSGIYAKLDIHNKAQLVAAMREPS